MAQLNYLDYSPHPGIFGTVYHRERNLDRMIYIYCIMKIRDLFSLGGGVKPGVVNEINLSIISLDVNHFSIVHVDK